MLSPEQNYELMKMKHAELIQEAQLQRQVGNIAHLVRQISFRLPYWVVTVFYT
jgi:hypothetical protein